MTSAGREAPVAVTGHRIMIGSEIVPAIVRFSDGTISAVEPGHRPGPGVHDAADAVVLPGLIDAHVHVNDPGRAHWEGFRTAGRAAAAGGVTTLIDMPLNCDPVTTTVAALDAKVAAARACRVDVGLWAGLVPGNEDRLEALLDAGALGVKCFLVDSGLPAFPPVDEAVLRQAMPRLAARGAVLLVHAELPGPMRDCEVPSRDAAAWAASRPPACEVAAIRLLVELVRATGCRVHIVHVAAAEAIDELRAARAAGLPISAETCPHYLTFDIAEAPDGATELKCAPPIRDARNREALWAALGGEVLDLVASDHSPCPPARKALASGDFATAWGGVASLELLWSATWTGARERGFGLGDVTRWLAEAPAALAGLSGRKGRIAVGYDADVVVVHPESPFRVNPAELHQRHPITPYAGRTLYGTVEQTWLRGRVIYERGRFPGEAAGAWLRPESA